MKKVLLLGAITTILVATMFEIDIDTTLHKVLLPVFERSLIFYTPIYVFTYLSIITSRAINVATRMTYGFDNKGPILLIGASAKSGCFLSTKIGLEIGQEFRKELHLGYYLLDMYDNSWGTSNNFKLLEGVREPIEYSKPGTLLHNGCHPTQPLDLPIENTRCVWFIRDPLKRLVSFYTYTVQFGEWQVSNASTYVSTLSLEDGIRWVFDWASETIELQDSAYVESFRDRYNCTEVEISELGRGGFDATMRRVLLALNVEANERILNRLRRHDLSSSSKYNASNPHPHASKATSTEKKRIGEIIMADDEMRSFVENARLRLRLDNL